MIYQYELKYNFCPQSKQEFFNIKFHNNLELTDVLTLL